LTPTAALYLPDTNIIVHYARKDATAQFVEATYSFRNSAIKPIVSIVTVGEIRSLSQGRQWGKAKLQIVEEFLAQCTIVSLDFAGIVDAYAELDNYSNRDWAQMGDNDLWIASTARITGAHIITTDKDFDHLHPKYLERDWIDPATR